MVDINYMQAVLPQDDSVPSTVDTLVLNQTTSEPADQSKPCLTVEASPSKNDVRSVINRARSELLKSIEVASKGSTLANDDIEEGELTVLDEVVCSSDSNEQVDLEALD